MRLKCKHRTTFWRKRRLEKRTQSRAMANFAKALKSAVFWDLAKGGPRENRPKSRPTIRAQKTPRRKSHYPLISMRLKCKHRTTFWRKRRLEKRTQSRAMANFAKALKSAVFWDLAKGGPRENRPKSRPTIRAQKTPRRKSHYPLISMRLKCKHRTTFWRKRRLEKRTQSRAMANFAKALKSAVFWDLAKGGPRENRPKSRPTIRAQKTPRRKSHYPLISMRLKCKHRTTFWRKRRLEKRTQSRAMANFAKALKSAVFWDLAKGGPRENRPKSRPTIRAQKTPRRKSHYPLISMRLKCKHRTTFWRKRRLEKRTQSRAMANFAKALKSAVFWDLAKGGPRENRPKSRPTIRAQKTPRRKSHYPLISMRLKCKHRTTFWRKRRLEKRTQSRAMANFAKALKSAVFWDLAKGGPRENRPKSRPTIRAQKTPRRKSHYPLISMRLKCKHRTTFWRKRRLEKRTQSRAMANFAKALKSAVFWDLAKGGPRENRPKSRPTIRAQKTPRRKSHYPLISMRLKCKHRTTFWRKRRLEKRTQSRAMANFAKALKSAVFWDLAKGGPRENRPKSRPTIRAQKTPRRKSHYPLISMRLKCKHRTTFWRKRRLEKRTQSRAMANFAKALKSAVFWDLAKGGPRENRPKSRPTIRAQKTPRRKSHYPLISMRLKCKHRTTFWRKRRLEKRTQSRAMANFAKALKSAVFWDLAKGGPRENRPKSRPTIRAQKTPRRKSHYPLISMRLKCKHRTTFWRKRRLEKRTQSRAMANFAKALKSAVFWDLAKGGPRENRPKSRPTIRAQKTPRRKSHYPLISMRLKCKHRTTFWRKRRLEKRTQSRAMANFAKALKSAVFWDLAKGGPRENRPKSRPTIRAQKTPRRKSHYPLISMRLKSIFPWSLLCQISENGRF